MHGYDSQPSTIPNQIKYMACLENI
jgi:hypothetical protein